MAQRVSADPTSNDTTLGLDGQRPQVPVGPCPMGDNGDSAKPNATDLVAELNLRRLRDSYAGRGSAAYHPGVPVALL